MEEKKSVTRRNFFQQGAVVFGVPALLGLSNSLFAKGAEQLNCGMIGTGGRGRNLLRRIVNSPGVRVTALCDINPQALEAALDIVGKHKPRTYTYYKSLLEDKELDAVFVVTPPFLHHSMVMDVLASGRSCYCEKPLCTTVDDLNKVVEAAQASKGILQVGQQLRYLPVFRKVMPMLHQGYLGKIGFIRAQRYSNWNGPGSAPPMRWLYSIEESGDQIVEQSVHELDVLNWVMNDHPVRIAGLGGQNMIFEPEGREICDHYGLTLEYPGGRHAVFSMLKYAPNQNNMGGRITHAYGEKGSIDLKFGSPNTVVWRGKQAPEPTEITAEEADMTQKSVDDFFRCIREGEKPFCDGETGRIAALTALLGRKAIYERRTVTWEDLLREGAPVKPIRG